MRRWLWVRSVVRLHPREVVPVLGDVFLDVAGPALPDDACLMVLDWYGGHGDTRSSSAAAGADPDRASTPDR